MKGLGLHPLFAIAALTCGALAVLHAQPRVVRPNVVFVVVDTTRADRFFGVRGAARWLARQAGTEFENAWSQAPTTNSAIATLFTGLLPSQHGVFDGGSELPRQIPTLAEHFRSAGYTTAHMTANPNSGPPYGLDRGFQHVRWSGRGPGSDLLHQQLQHADGLAALAAEFLAGARAPFLLSLHFNDPHSPYDPAAGPPPPAGVRRVYDEPSSDPSAGEISSGERDDMIARYHTEISSVDRVLARLVGTLRERRLWERTILVVTADHGEEFQDHAGWGHSHSLYPELLHVPLFIRMPGDRVRRLSTARVNHADILPTLLELAGLPPGGRTWGRSRAGLHRGQGRGAEWTIAEKLSTEKGPPLRALITDGVSLIEHADGGGVELYDARQDRAFKRNLASSRPQEAARLARQLRAEMPAQSRPSSGANAASIDADTLRHLQSLGYLQGRRATAGAGPASPGTTDEAIRTILMGSGQGRRIWSALARGAAESDNSPRAFRVEVSLPSVDAAPAAIRLRFAAADHATTISAAALRTLGPDGSSRGELPVTFEGLRSRRVPAGAIVESDPIRGAGSRWVVVFHATPLALVRVPSAARTRLIPIESGGTGPQDRAAATIDGTLGLIAVSDGGR